LGDRPILKASKSLRWDWRLEANLNRKANGLALEGPSVGLYVPLLEFNQYLKKVFQHTRSILAISPAKMQKRLPELLTDHELVGFYEAVWHARNPTHMIMIKLLIYTGLRNAELARVRLQDVDLDHCQLRVVQGKSSKDRSVLFPSSFRGELGQYIHGHRERRAVFLFESNRLRP
jgi:integrase/recombinase XerD